MGWPWVGARGVGNQSLAGGPRALPCDHSQPACDCTVCQPLIAVNSMRTVKWLMPHNVMHKAHAQRHAGTQARTDAQTQRVTGSTFDVPKGGGEDSTTTWGMRGRRR